MLKSAGAAALWYAIPRHLPLVTAGPQSWALSHSALARNVSSTSAGGAWANMQLALAQNPRWSSMHGEDRAPEVWPRAAAAA